MMPVTSSHFSLVCVLLCVAAGIAGSGRATGQSLGQRTFDEVDDHVRQSFCDPDFNGVDWDSLAKKTRHQLADVQNRSEAAAIINGALAELRTSHTYLYTLDDPELYELLGVFSMTDSWREQFAKWLQENGRDGLFFEGVGLRCQLVDDRWFIRSILPKSPANQTTIHVGDEIVSADGKPFHPFRSFLGRNNKTSMLTVRSQSAVETVSVPVAVSRYDPTAMFHDAIDASVRVVKQPVGQIGYVRMWSYAGQPYQDQLADKLLESPLADCDGLILDLRGGWGGASPEFLQLFLPPLMQLDYLSRDGSVSPSNTRWTKPTILLIDETVRSGKELFAYGFNKLHRGPIIGERTAGAVTAGSVFTLSNGCVLYLAVRRLTVDGKSLEGVGVAPTIEVKNNWRYSQGFDAPFERAVLEMKQLLSDK
jgi:carboxyl-terminal processing protease